MLCPGCQAPIEADAVFCGHCGSPLPPVHLRNLGDEEPSQVQSVEQWSGSNADEVSGERIQQQPFAAPAYPLTPAPVSKVAGSTPSPSPTPVVFAGAPRSIVPADRLDHHQQLVTLLLWRSF
ncbi:zinc ribbon domain-containing protein [Dictyobacter kobayashii]|uniref:Zinc-ribbon domain-containing protein n=1 Tax=Dictyobacter kobayashii TaxID=2014872 RepID=A0A402AIE2_9CHLR|nr:zinc ribbon domain-containing protein [Dictyobacter kobayashii]GCE18876.1 hypothetical protein KDK_26760 [Dictyobacter kobayashii]